jgi:predicted nucleic acid-binding protein
VILYLDSVVVIYLVEQHPTFGPIATRAVTGLAPTALVGSELVRMESLVLPRRKQDLALEADFEQFFQQNYRSFVPLDRGVFDRAIALRATYRFLKTPDSLHLASAVTGGCDAFVTNDGRLTAITEIRVIAI